jgi:glycosyltransferase involved in cell wall biosynthesis
MGCGTPVVTSNVSSLPEVAGDAAIMVDPYNLDMITDAIRQLINNQDLRSDFVQKGLGRAGQFTWEESARHLRQIYSDML